MVTLVSILTLGLAYRVSLTHPEATVAVWITFAVVVSSIVAEWSAQ